MALDQLIFIGLFISGIFPALYWWFHCKNIIVKNNLSPNNTPISVVIAARNASKDLKSNLPVIMNQDHPNFEVVLVDDGSDDDTAEWLAQFAMAHKNLRVIQYQKKGPGKKEALAHGIIQAQHDTILVTDADCRPVSDQWIHKMTEALGSSDIAFGYGPYRKLPGLLNKYIRFDTATIAIQYLSAASQGSPYMGVGRNMIYRKDLFTQSSGFDNHKDIVSGDDDLFIQELSDQTRSEVALSANSFVYSEPKRTWIQLIRQKTRHITTSVRYKWRDQILLLVYPIINLLFYSLLIYSFNCQPYLALLAFAFKVILMAWVLNKTFRMLQEKDLIIWIWVVDIVQLILYITLSINYLFRKKNRW